MGHYAGEMGAGSDGPGDALVVGHIEQLTESAAAVPGTGIVGPIPPLLQRSISPPAPPWDHTLAVLPGAGNTVTFVWERMYPHNTRAVRAVFCTTAEYVTTNHTWKSGRRDEATPWPSFLQLEQVEGQRG